MIFNKLKETMKIDFGLYKKNTLHRRIERRMATLKIDSLSDYNNHLQKNYGEADLLYKNILIGVTSFYRDFKAFDIIRRLLSERLKGKEENIVRVWVPGCSTGEEAYTLAIVISDILGERRSSWKVQIFATDIDDDALNIARKGSYPESALMPIDKQHQEQYFSVYDDQFLVDKSIREMVIFSRHDILSDPPFLKLDLITCRNLLIYLNSETQKKILPMFHYALNNHGLLMLGKSESIGQFHNYFKTMDNRWRIYQANYLGDENNTPATKIDHHRLYQYRRAPVEHAPSVKTLRDIFINKIQEYVMPMCLLINETQDIIFSGGKNPYLSRPVGVSSDNLIKNIHPQLVTEVRIALQKASKEQALAKTPYVKVNLFSNVERFVRVVIVPVDASSETESAILLNFQEEDPDDPFFSGPAIDTSQSNDEVVKQLETELLRTQNQMQTLVEELETSNEELQSLNEELQSANEELQSTNEELETTNEELQSTNEELQTAYSELRASYTEQEKKSTGSE